jgi:OOP family OmpA-OmpF porin
MKILLIGFLALLTWIALSTYIYVCKIKGLCHEPQAIEIMAAPVQDVIAEDTLSKPSVQENAVLPKDLIINFAFDESKFSADAKTDKYIQESKEYLNQNTGARLRFTGHADAIGPDAYNQALGYRRAQSVQHYFESKGIPASSSIIESKGETEPADVNSTSAGRANNRRTVVTIIK